MGDVIRFPGAESPGEIHDTSGTGEQPFTPDPHNMLFEGDGVSQKQFENAARYAISVLEAAATLPPARDTRELRENLVETYTAAQVVALLDEATPLDWRRRPELYRALALRFHLISIQQQHQQ